MARVKTTPAVKSAEKLTIASVKGQLTFDAISIKQNSNGKSYIATPHGAVYAKLDEITTGVVYSVVELSNGAIACNVASGPEKMKFFSEQKEMYPGLSIADIKDALGL